MTPSIILAIAAMGAGAFADLFYRKAQTLGINAASFIFAQSTLFSTTIWIAGWVLGAHKEATTATWIYGLPAGLIAYIGLLLFVNSLRSGEASVNVPIFRLSFVITAVVAVLLLGESVTITKVAGLLLAAAGVLSLANLGSSKWSLRSLAPLLVATLLFGIVGVLIKKTTIEGTGTIALIMVQAIAFQTGSFLNALISQRLKPNSVTVRYAPPVALFQLSWTFLLIQSLQLGDASVSYPIVQLSFVVTTLLAVLFLKEAMTRKKGLGLGLAVLAVGAFAVP